MLLEEIMLILILPQVIYGFSAIPIKIQMEFFRELDKNSSRGEHIWEEWG
jgi:hypothetical protein